MDWVDFKFVEVVEDSLVFGVDVPVVAQRSGGFQFLTLTNDVLINILEQLYIQAYFSSKLNS